MGIVWCTRRESNPRHQALQASALPTELRVQKFGLRERTRTSNLRTPNAAVYHLTLHRDIVFGSRAVHDPDLATIRCSSTMMCLALAPPRADLAASSSRYRECILLGRLGSNQRLSGLRLTAGRITTLPQPSKIHFNGSPSRYRT